TFETFLTLPPLGGTFPDFDYSMAAVAPDGTIVVVGDTTAPVNLDGVLLPMSGRAGILVKYSAAGTFLWADRFSNTLTTGLLGVTGITVAPNGNITVVGTTGTTLWYSTFAADGTQLATRTFALGASVWAGGAFRVDSLENPCVAGAGAVAAPFPTSPPTAVGGGRGPGVF